LLAGVVADLLDVPSAIAAIAALTFGSGVVVFGRMQETLPGTARSADCASAAHHHWFSLLSRRR
jgi:hypothetical protein